MASFDFAMKLLKEGDVVVSPGGGFGPAGEGFLRLALVENENRLRQAVRHIGRCLERAEPASHDDQTISGTGAGVPLHFPRRPLILRGYWRSSCESPLS